MLIHRRPPAAASVIWPSRRGLMQSHTVQNVFHRLLRNVSEIHGRELVVGVDTAVLRLHSEQSHRAVKSVLPIVFFGRSWVLIVWCPNHGL
jgi:hypothetical protein